MFCALAVLRDGRMQAGMTNFRYEVGFGILMVVPTRTWYLMRARCCSNADGRRSRIRGEGCGHRKLDHAVWVLLSCDRAHGQASARLGRPALAICSCSGARHAMNCEGL